MRSVATVVVLAFITMVTAALAGTGLAQVQSAAQRMNCQNNLKQLGIALHSYHDSQGGFPRAGRPNPLLVPEKRLSWLVSIIPFVEADNLYRRISLEAPWDAEENRFLAVIDYRVATCPGRPDRSPVSTMTPTWYVGVAGLGEDAAELPATDPRAGFFGFERTLKLEDIKGHTSYLLMLAETARTQPPWTAAGTPTVRGFGDEPPPLVGPGGQLGGLHSGGVNTLFADGSVRFLRHGPPSEMTRAMATLHGSMGMSSLGGE